MALLTDLVDLVSVLRSEMWVLQRQKPPRHQPMPRPLTAADRAAAAWRRRERADLQALLFPNRDGG